jgi:hypothetical protein
MSVTDALVGGGRERAGEEGEEKEKEEESREDEKGKGDVNP